MAEIVMGVAHLNQVIDEILNEITGAKTPLQMLSENKASHTSNPQYGLLAYPPSYAPSVRILEGLVKEEVMKIKFSKAVGERINNLASQSGVANEFKDKVTELNRRLTINDQGITTPRGKQWTGAHAHSLLKKGKARRLRLGAEAEISLSHFELTFEAAPLWLAKSQATA